MAARSSKISKFYFVPELDCFRLFAIGTEEAYNFELAGELAKLARDLPKSIPVVATLIPASTNEELRVFFNPKIAIGLHNGPGDANF